MAKRSTRGSGAPRRTLDARPDSVDFRDELYVPTLIEVPTHRDLGEYRKAGVPILDQGQEGACTGFGLATVAHFLLRTRKVVKNEEHVSPRMLYAMARRYDEWPGEGYEGSSARGAMKGWHKHGVCGEILWPYRPGEDDKGRLTRERAEDARDRPLGAYFRVNHRDLVAMHTAISETGILYATATVHDGWERLETDGTIPWPGGKTLGGHAFAIVAYDDRGFWVQNSWGKTWGKGGFARMSYGDWLANGTDIWVARLGVPVKLVEASTVAATRSAAAGEFAAYSNSELRPHIVSIGNDGRLRPNGPFGNDRRDVEEILRVEFPRLTQGWPRPRLLLYAHGGLVGENAAIQRVAEYRQALLDAQVYPLSFIWKSDYWTTLTNMLRDAWGRRQPQERAAGAMDFLLDRADDALEPLARHLTGKAEWDEMKENALAATDAADGGARLAAGMIAGLAAQRPNLELHVAGHSAGGIFMAPLVRLLTGPAADGGLGLTIRTCTLWAPACTVDLFKEAYVPAIEVGAIGRMSLFTLTDDAEQDDHCARIYNKSLLYLVSNAFEEKARIPLWRDGWPILGMEKFIDSDRKLKQLIKAGKIEWIKAPNDAPEGSTERSKASHHGDFDDDAATVKSTLGRILGRKSAAGTFEFAPSLSRLRDERRRMKV
jgi:hypothetical protein